MDNYTNPNHQAPPGAPPQYPQGGGGYPQGGQGGYPQQGAGQPGYQTGGYNPADQQQGGYPSQNQGGGQYPPQQQQQQQGGYPPQSQGGGQYPPQQPQGGYPPQQQQGYPPQNQGGGGMPAGMPPNYSQKLSQEVDAPTWQGEVHGELRDDNEAAMPEASAPSFNDMPQIQGYSHLGDMPPPPYEGPAPVMPDRPPLPSLTKITEEEAREAFLRWVSEHCCYGKGVVKDLVFESIQPSPAFHYRLESYTESRTTKWTAVPFAGGNVDGPMNGPAPQAWQILCNSPGPFQNNVQKFEVPHTASVATCHQCRGACLVRCPRCWGRGRTRCTWCHGDGRRQEYNSQTNRHESRRCNSCNGTGQRRCMTCRGHGAVPCPTCKAHGSLKKYLELTVTFHNNVKDEVVERTDLPDQLITKAQGLLCFQEEAVPTVFPVSHFPDQEVNTASKRACDQHAGAFTASRLHRQRHNVRLVPVAECRYSYKGDSHRFFCYGEDRLVWCEDYPASCCWGCSIL